MKIIKQLRINKFTAMLLSIVLLLGCMPFAVFAEGGGSEFVSENVLQTKIDLENSGGVIWYRNGRTIEESTARGLGAETVAGLVDGDLEKSYDIMPYGAVEYRCFGIRYAITESTYVSEFAMYGDYENLPCYYDIYVSDTLENLHFGGNFIGTVKCDGTVQKLSVNRNVKYLLVLFNSIKTNDNNARPKEVQLWSGNSEAEFTPTNLVKSEKLDSYSAVSLSGETASVYPQNAEKVKTVVTKDISNSHIDLYSNSSAYTGIQFSLTELTYIGKVLIDAGIWDKEGKYNEKYTVYAAASLDELYSENNIVAADVLCEYSSPAMVDINKYAQYIAVVCTEHNGIRIRNILIFDAAADPDAEIPFVAKNVLKTNLESSRCIQFYPSSYYVGDASKITTETLASFTDGNTSATTDCPTGLDWTPPRYIGAEFTLDGTYYVGELNIYSGYTTSLDTFEVYASDSFETLYSAESLVAKDVVCDGTKKTLTLNRNIKYVTFLISGIQLYCARIAEFEAWTAEPSDVPEPADNSKKVLTIGNSFAENASVYASEIANANGCELTFGYLKYPSCTLEKHLYAAQNDIAAFRFAVTAPDGTRTVVKSGDGTSFEPADETVNANGATVKEALQYTDWDIIVFQQESSNARSYETFSYLSDLINYVREYCPNAKLMFHQVWRWGEWDADQFALIKANSETAAREYGLDIIPTGLAFEYAREALGEVTAVNENDGHYQHANNYGMYIAGCVYTAKIFGKEISENTFTSHPVVNNNDNVALLTAAANRAVDYYNSIGDINGDGEINSSDMALLRKYLLGAETVDTTLADANGDGNVDIIDLIRIKRYLADNSVVLGR